MPSTVHFSLFTSHFSPPPAAWPYNPALSLWLSVDPLSDKYPGVSPYVYCANNLVRLVDPDGRTFEVADNEESHRDIISIVSEHHRDRICFGENGLVTVNTEGLSGFYFAHPYHSWERGTNENTNGLMRQYIPQRSSFENLIKNYLSDTE